MKTVDDVLIVSVAVASPAAIVGAGAGLLSMLSVGVMAAYAGGLAIGALTAALLTWALRR